jgi:nucleotide-binding universal stress UspA family protein
MKKILIAFDGTHFSEGALQFAKQLNEKALILLTGAFLPQMNYANLWSYSGGGLTGTDFVPLLEDSDAETIKHNINQFESYCRANHIEHSVHKEYFDFALPELKKESRFADLLIISSEVFYEQAGTEELNEYLKDALHDMECPVIVVPEKFTFPESNILSYDGSESSVFSIKQFAYLFPELTNNPTMLVFGNERNQHDIPEEANIRELLTHHFPDISFKASLFPEKYFGDWVDQKKSSIVICGAFGRSGLSMLFKKSFITKVISDHRLPVFIAHR